MSYYYHDVPGRLRIRTPLIKGNEKSARHIENFLGQIQGIEAVTSNTITGSITMNYDSKKVNSSFLVNILQERGIFKAEKALTNDQYIHSSVSKAGNVVYKALLGTAFEHALQGSPLALIGLLI
jgi:copper chaperone CopZ